MRNLYWYLLVASGSIYAAGHGPVFGLATPTNPAGGWSLDLSQMFRVAPDGFGSMLRAELGYGITENLKIALSGPAVFAAEPLPPARMRSRADAEEATAAACRFE